MTCHVIAVISLVCHKIFHGKRKPGVCDQTYFSFLSPAPLPNAHAHEEKYGWLARLGIILVTEMLYIDE